LKISSIFFQFSSSLQPPLHWIMDGAAAAEDPARKAWGGAAASKPIRIFCAGAHTCEPPVVARCSAYTKRSRRIINCLCLCALQFFNESLKCPALRREEIKKQNRKGEQARLSRSGTPGTVTSPPKSTKIRGGNGVNRPSIGCRVVAWSCAEHLKACAQLVGACAHCHSPQ